MASPANPDELNAKMMTLLASSGSDQSSTALYVLSASIFSLFIAFLNHHYGLRLKSTCCSRECSFDVKGDSAQADESGQVVHGRESIRASLVPSSGGSTGSATPTVHSDDDWENKIES